MSVQNLQEVLELARSSNGVKRVTSKALRTSLVLALEAGLDDTHTLYMDAGEALHELKVEENKESWRWAQEDLALKIKEEKERKRRATLKADQATLLKSWLKFLPSTTADPYYYNHISGDVSEKPPHDNKSLFQWRSLALLPPRLRNAVNLQKWWRGTKVRHESERRKTEVRFVQFLILIYV